MELFKYGILLLIMFLSNIGYNQILIGGEKEDEKKQEETNENNKDLGPKRDLDGETELYFGTNWSRTFRVLEENGDLFGKPLGERANEIHQNRWSFGLGFRNRVHEHIQIEGGIGFVRNGEDYSFVGIDTSFMYQTTYSYISMPVKVYYTYGTDVRFFAGGGVVPQMFIKYKQEQQWVTSTNTPGKNSISKNNGLNSFVTSVVANVGVQLKYSESWSLYFMPEYRWQLSNSNSKNDAYKHFARALGFNIGFAYQL